MERQSWCSHQSPIPIPLLFIIPAVADTPPRALSFFLAHRWVQRPVTKQRFRYKVRTHRYAQTSFPEIIRYRKDLSVNYSLRQCDFE